MNNNFDFKFGMYAPATDSIIINTGEWFSKICFATATALKKQVS